MAIKFVVIFACLLCSVVTGIPLGAEDVGTQTYTYSEHHISGASGTFKYPLTGYSYGRDERVTIYTEFPENTLFIVEDYNIESSIKCYSDKLTIHQWRGNVADASFCGISTEPKYFKAGRNFLLTFASDSAIAGLGFNLRWAPFEPL